MSKRRKRNTGRRRASNHVERMNDINAAADRVRSSRTMTLEDQENLHRRLFADRSGRLAAQIRSEDGDE